LLSKIIISKIIKTSHESRCWRSYRCYHLGQLQRNIINIGVMNVLGLSSAYQNTMCQWTKKVKFYCCIYLNFLTIVCIIMLIKLVGGNFSSVLSIIPWLNACISAVYRLYKVMLEEKRSCGNKLRPPGPSDTKLFALCARLWILKFCRRSEEPDPLQCKPVVQMI